MPIIIRTRYFDGFLQRVTLGQDISQVVLLAAGLDTLAHRLSRPVATTIFELDQPKVNSVMSIVPGNANRRPAQCF